MRMRVRGAKGRILGLTLAVAGLANLAAPAQAYLYWTKPSIAGQPVTGTEPGIMLPMPGAQPKELAAGLLWTMRAGLNVAALQCQFVPALGTVRYYNNMLKQHGAELQAAYATLGAYFKRVSPKGAGPTALDSFATKTYNSFSTLQAQLIFCETASSIGQRTLEVGSGHLGEVARDRMREFRNSLVPLGDMAFVQRYTDVQFDPVTDPRCYNKRGKEIKCKVK
ncbi:MAG: hypothetical protein JF586_25020 [Burkholderiales bacterium]|nr:hypothetical protein [Burkholderiales bacterium]